MNQTARYRIQRGKSGDDSLIVVSKFNGDHFTFVEGFCTLSLSQAEVYEEFTCWLFNRLKAEGGTVTLTFEEV